MDSDKNHAGVDETNRNVSATFSISADDFSLETIDRIEKIEYLTI